MPVSMLGAKWGLESGSWRELVYDCVMGMMVGLGHFGVVFKELIEKVQQGTLQPEHHESSPWSRHAALPAQSELKVVVVGFGRTGTYSVAMALEELGFPTLHTQHWYHHPSLLETWVRDIFNPSMQQGKVVMGEPDFDQIARLGYTATTDLPVALYYEQILQRFPHCKFILTTRGTSHENETAWLRSWETMTSGITPAAYFGSLFAEAPYQMFCYMRWMYAIVNRDDRFLTQRAYPLPPQNRTAVLQSYRRHNAAVRQHVPAKQLLEFQVGQPNSSWQTLCDFLEVSHDKCPTDTPFPRTNSQRSLRAQTGIVRVVIAMAILVIICVAVMAVARLGRALYKALLGVLCGVRRGNNHNTNNMKTMSVAERGVVKADAQERRHSGHGDDDDDEATKKSKQR